MATTGTSSFHIYYRIRGTVGTPSPRDHIIKDGEALCNYGVSVPDEKSLKPLSEVSKSEWAVNLSGYSNLCDECSKSIDYYDLIPGDLPEEPPEFDCPVCGETADSVDFTFSTALIHHKSDESFRRSFETHKIPRELYDVWRTNPDEPLTYPSLKEFIDDNPQVFRPEEYRQDKIEAQMRNENMEN
ncbi:hypothetical protein [Halomicrobium urmianum]|uniref:hypothetical protein n=1 Tax=Halomicrobium urmianum TaxID=1586233 RepID=UPI001CD97077|nr:hypothetical protein [Halomicrobium urmianum]